MTRYLHYMISFSMLGLFAFLLAGCSSTQIRSVWKDPVYAGLPKKVLVVVVAKEPINRRIIEDEFVIQLNMRGTEAIASYTVLTDKNQDDQNAIANLLTQLSADSVLISRLISKRQMRVHYPVVSTYRSHYGGRWPDYYRLGYEELHATAYSTSYEYALMETNLYDARNDNLLWAATTETSVTTLNQQLIKPYIDTIMGLMTEYGLLKK